MSGEDQGTVGKPNFQGKFKHERSENLEAFLAANGVNWVIRKMAANTSPELDITQDGDKFCIKLQSMFHSKESNFTVGEEFEEAQLSGDVMKIKPEWDGNKLVMHYTPKVEGQGKPQKFTRELQGDELVMTLELDDVVAKRIFKKSE